MRYFTLSLPPIRLFFAVLILSLFAVSQAQLAKGGWPMGAGGVSGTFSGPVNTNLPSGFKTSLSYDPNNVFHRNRNIPPAV